MKPKLDTKQVMIASAIVLALALALGIYAFRGILFSGSETPEAPQPTEEVRFQHPLTGEPLEEPIDSPQVYGVMIDNSIDAWPQTGIDEAFLVIEAPVEAGITRFLAFFHEGQEIEKIGPVRSARPYFVDWNNELDGLYVHVGGSPDALDLIETNGTFDLNQFFNGNAYWRSNDRFPPHNAYTSTERLGKALERAREEERAPEILYGRWDFLKTAQDIAETPRGATIDFSARTYQVQWEFNEETRKYERRQSGLPHVTEDGTRLTADNVAIMVTDMKVIDIIGRREIRTTGEGRAWVLRDGEVFNGTWKKPSETERVKFYDTNDNEIQFNPGTTWIEVMHTAEGVIIDPES